MRNREINPSKKRKGKGLFFVLLAFEKILPLCSKFIYDELNL